MWSMVLGYSVLCLTYLKVLSGIQNARKSLLVFLLLFKVALTFLHMVSIALPILLDNKYDGDSEGLIPFYCEETMTKDVEQHNTSFKAC